MVKGSLYQKDEAILNAYTSYYNAMKYVKLCEYMWN
jgi:hypothetical protein